SLCRVITNELSGARILEQELDGLRRVLLVRADHARRAALDPARGVRALGALHTPPVVRDRPAALVERDAGECDALVAHAPQHQPRRDDLGLPGGTGDEPAVLLEELVAHDLDPFHPVLADDRERRGEEAKHDAAGLPLGRALGEPLQQLIVPAGAPAVLVEGARAPGAAL